MLHRFVHGPDDDDYAYWRSFSAVWRTTDTIVNVEHDMEFSSRLVADLLCCPRPLCSHAYRMHVPKTHFAHSVRADAMDGFWVRGGVECAAYSAIGFCKIAPEVRAGPLGRTAWRGVEWEVNAAVRGGGGWHLHWPGVEHYHKV